MRERDARRARLSGDERRVEAVPELLEKALVIAVVVVFLETNRKQALVVFDQTATYKLQGKQENRINLYGMQKLRVFYAI